MIASHKANQAIRKGRDNAQRQPTNCPKRIVTSPGHGAGQTSQQKDREENQTQQRVDRTHDLGHGKHTYRFDRMHETRPFANSSSSCPKATRARTFDPDALAPAKADIEFTRQFLR